MTNINRNNNYALLSLEGEIKELVDNSLEKKYVIYEKIAQKFEQINNIDWQKLYQMENENNQIEQNREK